MREHLNLANGVTSLSLAAGFSALLLVLDERVALAAGLVAASAVLDGIDGALARRRGGDHTFGAQLDSLTDLLSFCVVPAVALYLAMPGEAAMAGALVSGGIVLAGAWRLARFALDQKHGHFRGLPTPAAGLAVMGLVLWAPATASLLTAALLAILMASSLPFPTVPTAAAVVRERPPRPVRRVRERRARHRHARDRGVPTRRARARHAIARRASRRRPRDRR